MNETEQAFARLARQLEIKLTPTVPFVNPDIAPSLAGWLVEQRAEQQDIPPEEGVYTSMPSIYGPDERFEAMRRVGYDPSEVWRWRRGRLVTDGSM